VNVEAQKFGLFMYVISKNAVGQKIALIAKIVQYSHPVRKEWRVVEKNRI
jgi:hypothetical protein